jgi:hypothetical protein
MKIVLGEMVLSKEEGRLPATQLLRGFKPCVNNEETELLTITTQERQGSLTGQVCTAGVSAFFGGRCERLYQEY